eukprot:TRINITY_DN5493_c2_g1_i1.p1 TRINITY_DN5493_c2_g1~~TRINITY_DN5493_c2_g1_i1.p1  ORF type:complete len:482 (+),score=79.48 TRINITY_DN5493_c2_g1_i1:168-1613(+)
MQPHSTSTIVIIIVVLLPIISSSSCVVTALPSPPSPSRIIMISPSSSNPSPSFPWFDPTLPTDTRINSLIAALNISEKFLLITSTSSGLPHLGIPYYDWTSEGSHGVARAGRATVFPSPISLASSFNEQLLEDAGKVLAIEARGKHNEYANAHNGTSVSWYGLNFYAPNINLFIHPLWGRGQETFGEDPYLTSMLSVSYVKGMQNKDLPKPDDNGGGKKYVKAGATCKHFFAYSTTEVHNVTVSNADTLQTFFPAFEACVREGRAGSVMCSYSIINGVQACGHPAMQEVLRDEWGFEGFVVSDDEAISSIKAPNTSAKVAIAIRAGVDLGLGDEYNALPQAYNEGLINDEDIDLALSRVLRARLSTGQFDPPSLMPSWSRLNVSNSVDLPASRLLARQAAREGTVLLKNEGVLPLKLNDRARPLRRIAVVGPNADRRPSLLGNYCGCVSGDANNAPIDPQCNPSGSDVGGDHNGLFALLEL